MRNYLPNCGHASGFSLFLILILAAESCGNAADLKPQEVRQIAAEAYVYAYPLVLMDVTRSQVTNVKGGVMPGFGPMNAFWHFRKFPDAEFRTVVRPNFDTLYSSAWLDLTKEPVIVSAPDTGGRYYLLPMIDMWTDVFAVPGKRTSGTKAGHFAVVGPGWTGSLPKGVTRLNSPTPYVWIIGRTQTNGPKDYAAVHKIQNGYRITPLSYWGKEERPVVRVKINPAVDMKTPPLIQLEKMSAKRFFTYVTRLMALHPPHISDGSILLRMKRIGLVPGKSLDFDKLDASTRRALEMGAKDGLASMKKLLPTIAPVRNGWQINIETMGVYGNSYMKRAIVAMAGLGANQQDDAVYPLNFADAEGKPMSGDKKYVLHFKNGELPPAGAFWSVTMYDAQGFQVANSINRYAIGDRDALKFNRDGSLDIYIQHKSPGKERESNWLPGPAKGTLGVTMRLYAPKQKVLTGDWTPPAIKRVK